MRNNLLEKKEGEGARLHVHGKTGGGGGGGGGLQPWPDLSYERFPKGLPRGWRYFNGHVDCTARSPHNR